MNTPNTIKEGENERIENFLKLLKTNPEAIEHQVIKNNIKDLLEHALEIAEGDYAWATNIVPVLIKLNIFDKSDKEWYKDLLEHALEIAKDNSNWTRSVVPELIKLNILDKSDKEWYKDLLEHALEIAKDNSNWAGYIIPGLLKLNILDKSDKEWYKDLLEHALEIAEGDYDWARSVVPELIKLNILDKSEIKENFKDLLEHTLETAEDNYSWAKYVVPELIKLDILDKSEIKEDFKDLLEHALKAAEDNYDWARYIVPELIKLNIIDKCEIKEPYKDLLNLAMEKSESDDNWAKTVVPELIKLNILDKSDKEWYKDLLEHALEIAEGDYDWAGCIVPELIKLNILDKSEIKEDFKDLLEHALKIAKNNSSWARGVVPELIKLNILDKSEIKEPYKDLLYVVMEESKSDNYLARSAVPELIKLNILDKSEIKEPYKHLLNFAMEKAKSDCVWARSYVPELIKLNIFDKSDKEWYKDLLEHALKIAKNNSSWTGCIVPELIKLNILDKSEIKEDFKDLLEHALQIAKGDYSWAGYIVPELIKLNILDKSEIKEPYKDLLYVAMELAKWDDVWAKTVVPELIKLNILDKSDKEWYKRRLDLAKEEAKSNYYWAEYIFPELLKLNIIDKCEINIDIDLLQHVTLVGTSFLEKNKDKINEQDVEFIDQIDDYFSKEEINYLYKQYYEYFKKIEITVKEKNYQKIWEIKKLFYSGEEKDKIEELEKHFGKGIWTYFVDKVPGNKTIKNRFRDPHNALLRDIINFYYKYLAKNGVTKTDFLKNYLGVAGDRNNGYQQINNFIEKGKSNWKELVEGAIEMDEFKENTKFKDLAERILEQERTGELYKNLDNLEQILTLLHMIRHKESLIKLGKLANSDNPDDKVLYEYYKGAIYHPRTKPIIMKMYEKPGEFLGLDDTTFSTLDTIHQAKKPSNMVENFKYLDFDAKDLVDCLPLGVYDKLSYFKPFEMKFFINGRDVFTKDEIQQVINEFLIGADQKKISVIISKLKKQSDETMWFKEWKANKDEFVKNLLGKCGVKNLVNIFVNLGYSEFNKFRDLREMTAKISPKSDPNNWFNGFNCDSLAEGHGKKVVAMFNPYCTDFCIYEGKQDPKEDNLKVTSWVTLNRAIPENFTTLLRKVKSETTHYIANILGDKFEDYKDPNEYVITMDNIEANPNFGRKNEVAVRKMYEKFFSEYVRQNPISPNGIPINTHKFYSGMNYNKQYILTDEVPNESLPVFVNAYSDNSESYSLKGKLDAGEQKEKKKKTGIHPLSIEDVVQISYMEGKIYPSSMKDHLGNLQHEITASILNNTLKGRPNLSFTRYNEEGKIGGYILAYQGKMEDGTPGIYISDFAMDEKNRKMGGGKLIYYRIKHVKKYYPDMPIFTRARALTSYRLIKDEKTEKYTKPEKYGYKVIQDEVIEDGGENFHWVVMNPKK